MTKKISQREARRLRLRAAKLESNEANRVNRWSSDYPDGVCVGSIDTGEWGKVTLAQIETAMLLDRVVLVKLSGKTLRFIAVQA